ncbi:MAG: hypothetical protein VW440_04055 [Bordetella sp.]
MELKSLIRQNSGDARESRAAQTRRAAKVIVLVDEVLTTGATASVCTQALQSAGDRVIGLAVLARAD